MKNIYSAMFAAGVLMLALAHVSPARAEDFSMTINVPVDVSRLSPNIYHILLQCDLYTAGGKRLIEGTDYDVDDAHHGTDIGSSRGFKGTLRFVAKVKMSDAELIDWGSYSCTLQMNNHQQLGQPSPTNPNPDYASQPGAVSKVSGSLF